MDPVELEAVPRSGADLVDGARRRARRVAPAAAPAVALEAVVIVLENSEFHSVPVSNDIDIVCRIFVQKNLGL